MYFTRGCPSRLLQVLGDHATLPPVQGKTPKPGAAQSHSAEHLQALCLGGYLQQGPERGQEGQVGVLHQGLPVQATSGIGRPCNIASSTGENPKTGAAQSHSAEHLQALGQIWVLPAGPRRGPGRPGRCSSPGLSMHNSNSKSWGSEQTHLRLGSESGQAHTAFSIHSRFRDVCMERAHLQQGPEGG